MLSFEIQYSETLPVIKVPNPCEMILAHGTTWHTGKKFFLQDKECIITDVKDNKIFATSLK